MLLNAFETPNGAESTPMGVEQQHTTRPVIDLLQVHEFSDAIGLFAQQILRCQVGWKPQRAVGRATVAPLPDQRSTPKLNIQLPGQ